MTGAWGLGGATALALFATEAGEALAALAAAWPDALTTERMALLRAVPAEGLGLPPLPGPTTDAATDVEPGQRELPVLEFAEQFAVDVTRVDDGQRDRWGRAFRDAVVDATVVVYVAEWVPRLRSTLDALFGAEPWPEVDLVPTPRAYGLMDDFLRAVARLHRLDPVTAELVRLRGARLHGSRVATARRSVAALEAGADATMFAGLDEHRGSDLSPARKAALALTDAMIWTPADLRAVDLDAVRTHLEPAEAVEVALRVVRDASEKIGVGLAVDTPPADGLQLFDVDAAGRLVFP